MTAYAELIASLRSISRFAPAATLLSGSADKANRALGPKFYQVLKVKLPAIFSPYFSGTFIPTTPIN